MAALVPFCSSCLKALPSFDLVLATACHHLYCSDCIQRLEKCPLDAIAWGELRKHDVLVEAFQAYCREPDEQRSRKVFALVNTKGVRCKLMGTRTHLKGSCPYSHALKAEAWECTVCGLDNEGKGQICAYCAAIQPRTPKFLALNLLPSRAQTTPYWLCHFCRLENGYETETCWGCMRRRLRPENANEHSNARNCDFCEEMKPVAWLDPPSQGSTTNRKARIPLRTGAARYTPKPRSASPIVHRRAQTPVTPSNPSPLPRKYNAQSAASDPTQPVQLDLSIVLTVCALLGLLLYALFTR